jgi:hypothetical protein
MTLFARRALLAAACCLMLGPVTAADLDPTGDLKTQAGKFVKVEKPAVLNGLKRVVITSYMVDYVTELRYTKSLSGFEAMIGADSDVSIKLVGGDHAQFQTITDKFYAQTVEELAAQGIQVVPHEELAALPEFAELAADAITPLPSEQDAKAGKGLFFSAKGLPLHLIDETQFITIFNAPFTKPREDNFLTFGSRFSGGFSVHKTQQAEEKIAKKLDATVLKVRLTILGGQLTPDTSFWSGGKVSTKAAASFVDFVSRYAFITPSGDKARVSLQEIAETGEIGVLMNTTSDTTAVTDTAKNAALVALNVAAVAARFGGLNVGGIGGFSATKEYELRVQPEPFEQALLTHQRAVAKMFGEKIRNPGQE